jgi:primosomal protein N' (replication factor Y)
MLVEVALPVPLPRTYTYHVDRRVAPGTRVRVPFGRRRLVGWVVSSGAESTPLSGIKTVERVLEKEPSLPAELLRLCQWTAEYYVIPLGQVLRSALPAALSDVSREQLPGRTRRVLRLTRELPSLNQRDALFGRAQRQRECYEALEAIGGTADTAHLTKHMGFSSGVLRGLVERELAELVEETVERDPFALVPLAAPVDFTLTSAQRSAVHALTTAARGAATKPFLLHGVTGSGKTLVYIELLKEVVLRQQRGAIVLVPEIALTPQTVARFRAEFGDSVAVLHSALSDGERYDAWRALRSGARRIAVGARSAIFAPISGLGAIVVDEEHEATYKQGEAPRYHARELAVVRAQMSGAVCVLGSATPSLESWHNTQIGKFELLVLPVRVAGRPLPPVRLVDMRAPARSVHAASASAHDHAASAHAGSGSERVLSTELVAAITNRLSRREQTILLLNRRGYSTFVQCRDCGRVWQCEQCNVSLTFHRGRRRLVCHYCMREEPAPAACPECAGHNIAFRGVGTEQVERTVIETFPDARIARMDVDTTSAKWSHHRILSRFEQGDVDILLGTQMIAKGLDFPGVTLVGVVNADVSMNLPDFRAAERTFQLLTQVAGRAGRGEKGGEVLIQTALPGHYAIRAALEHDYATFAEREISERKHPLYPPLCRLANVVVSGIEEGPVQEAAEAAAEEVKGVPGVEVVGPAPCPIDRVRGRWRWHFFLRSEKSRDLAAACLLLLGRNPIRPGRSELRLILDRDPVSLL